ncbi:hypothetical protein REPUB_Repub15cG0039200 [Reevesia pubescens]
MPKNPAAWSAWNFLGSTDKKVCLTYWLNVLQNLGETSLPFLVTLNPDYTPQNTLLKWRTGHPVPSVAATKASLELDQIQGKRGIWFCGAYQGALLFVTRFLGHFISTGCVILLVEGGTMFTFEGTSKKCSLKTVIKVHNPHFYWKARIDSKHEILEIGYGWGSLAIEVVKRTGCKYTGITLSEEQLKFAETRVKEAGLQGNIRFQLCDYRQLPNTYKYDRIISCEMIEAVGHEYMEEFFGCSESVLAEDGLLVLQFISIPEERYDEYRRSSDFIKEYIFRGGCLPSLTRITSAMSAASRLCVEHVENIGLHYYQTLRYWRKNFLEKQRTIYEIFHFYSIVLSKILALGFNVKFIGTWEYYFDYCAAGFKSNTLGNYQAKMASSFMENMARNYVTKFFQQFISTGCMILKEEDGTVLTFKGNMEKCCLEVVLKVQNPQFYWKILTEADLGLADAYIHGDFTFEDKEQGLLNLFLIFIANRQSSNSSASGLHTKRGWWAPALVTASISSAKYFLKHVLRQNTLAQARRNISRHYDLSNELFELFMGETMLYSSAIFKAEDEDLNLAQLRKVSSLIDKRRGMKFWKLDAVGVFFAIEVVKRTGCKYIGLTLSQEQLKYAEAKVKEAGLQVRMVTPKPVKLY